MVFDLQSLVRYYLGKESNISTKYNEILIEQGVLHFMAWTSSEKGLSGIIFSLIIKKQYENLS